jgi:phosphatidylglycerophosphate synthase
MPGKECRGAEGEAGSYSRVESYGVRLIQRVTTKLLGPAVRLLVTLRISPNLISLLQPVLGLVMVLTVATQRRFTLALLLLALLLDGVDGTLARETGRASAFGALVDQFSDHAREVLLVAGLARIGALSSFWATLYALAYPGSNLALLVCNRQGVPVPVATKTYTTFYPPVFLYLWAGVSCLTPAAAVAVTLMLLTNGDGLRRLSEAMGN